MKSAPILVALLLSLPAFAAAQTATPANPRAGMGASKPALTQSGKVLSTIRAPGYIYLEVSQGKQTKWLAASTQVVKKGDGVRFDEGMEMTDFYSKSLNRSFPNIVFVNHLVVDSGRK